MRKNEDQSHCSSFSDPDPYKTGCPGTGLPGRATWRRNIFPILAATAASPAPRPSTPATPTTATCHSITRISSDKH